MIRTTFAFLLLLVTLPAFAQITLDQQDFYQVGKTYKIYQAHDDGQGNLGDSIDLAPPGTDQVFDFSQVWQFVMDSSFIQLIDPANVGFSHGFNQANVARLEEIETLMLRPKIELDNSDFPNSSTNLTYSMAYDTGGIFFNMSDTIHYQDSGGASYYNFMGANIFKQGEMPITYINANEVCQKVPHSGYELARLLELDTVGQDTLIALYGLYGSVSGEFQLQGLCAELDSGAFMDTITGTKIHAVGSYSHPIPQLSEDFDNPGYFMQNATQVNLTANFGQNRSISHTEKMDYYYQHTGWGMLYTSQDSFQVLKLKHAWIQTNIDTFFTNNMIDSVQQNIDTIYTIKFYTKGLGHPLATLEVGDYMNQFIYQAEYFQGTNLASLMPMVTDTVLSTYEFYRTDNQGTNALGLGAMVDQGYIFGNNYTGIKDTLEIDYLPHLPIIQASHQYNTQHEDTSSFEMYFLDSLVKLAQTFKLNRDVDAYGKLMIPGDSADVLRMKVTDMEIYSYTFYDSAGNILFQDMDVDSSYYYEFWSKGLGFPTLRAYTDDQFSNVHGVEYTAFADMSTGLDDYTTNKIEFNIFPNPVDDYIHIQTSSITAGMVYIFDVKGGEVLETPYRGNKPISVEHLNPGAYTLILQDKENVSWGSQKIIIK